MLSRFNNKNQENLNHPRQSGRKQLLKQEERGFKEKWRIAMIGVWDVGYSVTCSSTA